MILDISNFIRLLLEQYIKNKDFNVHKAFLMLDLFENSDSYTYVLCNSELKELIDIKFLYYKNNHDLKIGCYSSYFGKKQINFNNFKTNCFVISVVVHDNIDTYLIFKKDSPLMFKKWLYDVLHLDYITILNKNNFKHISRKEEDFIKSLNPYALIGVKDINLTSLGDEETNDLKDIIFHLERKLIKTDERFKKLIKVPIKERKKPLSSSDLYPLVNKLKQNKKAHDALKKELDGLYESFYKDLRYESEYETSYFKNLLFQNKSDFIAYESFEYSLKELKLLDKNFKSINPKNFKSINNPKLINKKNKDLDKNRSKQLIKLVCSLH